MLAPRGVPLPSSAGLKPGTSVYNPVANFVTGVSNIIKVASSAVNSFVSAATTPAKSNLAVYNPSTIPYTPPIQLSGLYGYNTQPTAQISQITSQYTTPIVSYNYAPPTNQPISVIVNPQPITINVPGAQAPVFGPVLPAIENALSPFIAAMGQVINPIVRIANTLTNGELNKVSSETNRIIYAAEQNLRDMIGGARTDLQRQIDAANRSTSDQIRNISIQVEDAKRSLGPEFVAYKAKTEGTLTRLSDELARYGIRANEVQREITRQYEDIQDQIKRTQDEANKDLFVKIGELLSNVNGLFASDFNIFNAKGTKAVDAIADKVYQGAKGTIDSYQRLLDDLRLGKITNMTDFLNRIELAGGNSKILFSITNIVSIFAIITKAVTASSEAWIERIDQLAEAEYKTTLIGANDYIDAEYRAPSKVKFLTEQLYRLGLNDENIDLLRRLSLNYLTIEQIVAAENRGDLSSGEAAFYYKMLKIDGQAVEIIRKLGKIIPPVQDIITMAVREVFNPSQRKQLTLDADLPEDFVKWAQKQGLSGEWAGNYWAAHWQLPSPQQVFDMLHRRKADARLANVNEDFVNDYLKANDYAPVWREKLSAISYNTLARVDIRRMYKAGVLDDEIMHIKHLALGMTEQDANFLDDYTRRTSLPEDETDLDKIKSRIEKLLEGRFIAGAIDENTLRSYMQLIGKSNEYINQAVPLFAMEKHIAGLENEAENIKQRSISAIISARQRGNISRTLAKRNLLTLGLSELQAEQSIIYADLQYTIKVKEKAQDVYQRQYALHNMQAKEFRTALQGYEFSTEEIDRALLEAELLRADKTKKLPQSQLDDLVNSEVITVAQYTEELRRQGLNSQSVTWLALLKEKEKAQ